jgi:phosphoribosylformylglycinamidine cyclo-ligase
MGTLNYADSGVNRELADQFVDKIAFLAKATLNKNVKAAVGGYASLYALDKKRWIAASTDGVGTKLKLAFQLGDHRTVGIDLVAMSVNDLLCVGAEPLFFLDYFATGTLNQGVAVQVLEGIVEGCKQAQCALVGGETAEMPDFYTEGEYDLAGFAVGQVNPAHVLPRKEIRPGDILIGIGSSGFHSNGYSLLRKLAAKNTVEAKLDRKAQDALLRDLLTPTRIYVKAVQPLLGTKTLKGLSHITGSGFLNVPRMSDRVSYEIHLPPAAERPEIFGWLKAQSGLSFEELAQTFNLGIGMVAAVSKTSASQILRKIKRSGEKAWIIGEVKKCRPKVGSEVFIHEAETSAILKY